VRDYVEFPSQLLENWLPTPEVLNRFALHYQTGKPIPAALVARINKASTFNEGFATTEFMASALIDMKLHLAGDKKIDPDKFERETLAQLGMPSELVMRHRTPQFTHVFSSDGYSAGYYSYLWSVVLAADGFTAFTEAGGPYDKAVAARLRQYVYTVGNTIDPAVGYRAFRGRDPKIDALMKQRGFPRPTSKAGNAAPAKKPAGKAKSAAIKTK
jgi:peptidyl-dipeptidase Dcp